MEYTIHIRNTEIHESKMNTKKSCNEIFICKKNCTLHYSLWLMLTVLTCSAHAYGPPADNLREHDEVACDGDELHLRCPGSDIIHVREAFYGRQDDMRCVSDVTDMEDLDLECSLPNIATLVAKKCNGKTLCEFVVGPETFSDPCSGTKKYLEVKFECVPLIISCPGKLISARQTQLKETSLNSNGAFVRDPYQETDRIYFMEYETLANEQMWEFSTFEDLVKGKPLTFYQMDERADGTGFVVYDRNLYYNVEATKKVVRFDLSTQTVAASVILQDANYHNTSPYYIDLATDIDLAVDENGLWVIYATEKNQGNIVISRLEHHSLKVINTWSTKYDKMSALNSFMICGVLYAVNGQTLKIDYMYNTSSGQETKDLSIVLPGINQTTSEIDYNPKDRQLYVWDQGRASTYKLGFQPVILTPPSPTTPRTTTTTTTTTTKKTTQPKPTKPKPPTPQEPAAYCEGTTLDGISWEDTPYGETAKQNCPGWSPNQAIWVCGGNRSVPQWVTKTPDFNRCVSGWIRDIKQKMQDRESSAAVLSSAFRTQLEIQLEGSEDALTSWDIVTSAELLEEFFNRSTTEELHQAATLTDNILKSTSLLLKTSNTETWKALDTTLQNKIAGKLLKTLEDSAFFLSYDMSVEENEDDNEEKSLNLLAEQVTLGIRVEPIKSYSNEDESKYKSIRWWSGQGDSVKVVTNSVLDAVNYKYPSSSNGGPQRRPLAVTSYQNTTRHLSIVLLSFRNIGDYMKDPELFSTHKNPVNSRIVSVSSATIAKTANPTQPASMNADNENVIVNKHNTIKLSKPLSLTIKHIQKGFAHNVCVYWKFIGDTGIGQWSRKGCKRITGNDTHSKCECNHMTSFAVLSSNEPFPAMDSDMYPEVKPVPSNPTLQDLPIVRTGLAASLLCLLIVAITLIAVRSIQSDTNTIHKNLVMSLIFTEIVFITGIDFTVIPALCGTVAALLHFGLLAAFTWATLEAFNLMVTINEVTERQGRWRWYYAVGYGLPAIVVATSAAVDHDGYGMVAVCWLKAEGSFIWSFIGPCCFTIVCCVIFLAVTMYKLHLHAINFSLDVPKNKNIRAGVARSCVLMFLLCGLWSCGVLWLSKFETRVTSTLFCILLAAHGMATLVLYCVLSPEVRRKYKRCLYCRRKTHLSHHPSAAPMIVASNLRHPSTSSAHTNTLRQNETMQYPGYNRYTLGSSGGVCPEYTTTLVPESFTRNMALNKTANMMDQRAASEMELTRITNVTLEPRYSVNRGHSDGSAMDLADNTSPKTPLNAHTIDPRLHQLTSNGQYAPPSSGAISYNAHHYEQPLPHFSTMSSGASGAYNHLHEDYPSGSHHHAHDHCTHQVYQPARRGNHYETLATPCPDCTSVASGSSEAESHRPQAVHYRHRYEDVQPLTVCVTQSRPDVQCASYPCCDNANTQQYRVASTSSNGDLVNSEVRIMGGSNKGRGCRTMPGSKAVINQNKFNQNMPPSTNSFPQNQGYIANGTQMPRHHSNIVMGTSALGTPPISGNAKGQPPLRRQRNGSYNISKTGRASDPLSTDQGYDTDSQILQCKNCGGTHNESDQQCSNANSVVPQIKQPLIVRPVKAVHEGILHPGSTGKRLLPPSPATSSSTSGSIHKTQPERNIRATRKKGSTSDLSDCTSENDREVEMIYTSANGSSTSSPAAHGDSGAFDEDEDDVASYNGQVIVEPPAAFSQPRKPKYNRPHNNDDLPEDLIDVERGGRMSVAESVTSWCGQSGSNHRGMNPSYGKQKSTKKSTNDPEVILANARRSSNFNHGSNPQLANNNHNEQNVQRHNSTHNGYTLRGSTEAGTKARVDLKAGNISMVTNL